MNHHINIPAICPYPVGNPDSMSSYVSSQPIIQLKELEVDRVRYDQWKSGIRLSEIRKARWKKGKQCPPRT